MFFLTRLSPFAETVRVQGAGLHEALHRPLLAPEARQDRPRRRLLRQQEAQRRVRRRRRRRSSLGKRHSVLCICKNESQGGDEGGQG